ncbi:hypothetical protein [Aurantiacibacter luteus]|uniref:hypothetical protein n=1 Tax=Aurantiacibacter luteus TaxID=1581420 RepID=UPI000A68AF5C|nr:hypothetical protein [Aurantiacibacter luteus]
MTRDLPTHHRATDPGGYVGSFGSVTWVHCPQCNKAARKGRGGVSCAHCGHRTIHSKMPRPDRWALPRKRHPVCEQCDQELPHRPAPTAHTVDGELRMTIICPHCDHKADYPAVRASSPQSRPPYEPLRRFLETQVAGETLWVNNLAHLDAIEQWIGAAVRERGDRPGLTMMARLPRWMKASTNREKVLRGLANLRERAQRAGIDE